MMRVQAEKMFFSCEGIETEVIRQKVNVFLCKQIIRAKTTRRQSEHLVAL